MNIRAGSRSPVLRDALARLPEGGLERQAIEAGEIDAVIDYGGANVILFPAARRALRVAARRASAESTEAAFEAPVANSVLAALPRADYQRLLPGLEPVTLKFGEVLHEPGAPIRYVYFPVDCVVCLLTTTAGQRAIETGLVGYEGMVGIALALGVDVSPTRALVQAGGTALRMSAACFDSELQRCPQLQRELCRYACVKMNHARQTVACVASHVFEQRLACWLLMTSDRLKSREILLTQEFLSTILDVTRVSVTLASGALQSRNLIRYIRGKIRIVDREGLEAASCACYSSLEALHRA
ncbi:MAG TPA: Crp/Fnr family transcriptional regulator [Burkholderiaceae bacterium]